jgi:glutathione S-transferase
MTALLTYFDVRGRAEVVRLMFEEAAHPYRERRVQVEEWPALKPSLPFGQLPSYEEDGLFIVQSHAIYRYLARKLGFTGSDEAERVRCDVAEELFVELQNNLGTFYWSQDFAAKRDAYEQSTLPELLAKAERLLTQHQGGDGWWAGAGLTLADFVAWHFLDYVRPFSQRTLDRFEKLSAFKRRFEARPRIAAYLQSERRPKTLTVRMCPFGGTPETS